MRNTKDESIKVQEWVVMFDGDMKFSEKFIDKISYHKDLSKNGE